MTYHVDEKDVAFNLYECLKINELTGYAAYAEQGEEFYKMVLDAALKFSQKEIDPLNKIGDEQGCKIVNGNVTTPKGFKEAYKAFAENGFIGMDVSPNFGGQGLPSIVSVVANEFFTGANIPFSMYSGLTRGSAHLIEAFGTSTLSKLFCEKMYNGEWGGTMCLTEPWAGSDVGALRSVAKPNSDGTFNITGSKIFISSGDHDLTSNIIHLVLARVEGDAPGTKGISLFAVPKIWVNADGSLAETNDVACVNIEHKMGIKASSTCALNFGEKGKCRGFLVGEKSLGMRYMFQMMNEARLMCGMQGQSVAAAAYEHALRYAKERVQGGTAVLLNHPDVRRNLSLCKAWVEGMRALLYKTAVFGDKAHHETDAAKKERYQNRIDLLTPICKAYCSDYGFKVTEIAMQIYGGYGYCSEYPIEQYMRDVKISSIYEGTNGIQALDFLGRKLSSKGGALFREFYEDMTAFNSGIVDSHELKESATQLQKSADTAGQVAMKFMEIGMAGDRDYPMLSATPFLELVGHITIAWHLMEQAVVADNAIKAGSTDSFYRNKIRTAKFFVAQILPNVQARAKSILSMDRAALEMEF